MSRTARTHACIVPLQAPSRPLGVSPATTSRWRRPEASTRRTPATTTTTPSKSAPPERSVTGGELVQGDDAIRNSCIHIRYM